MSKRKLSLVLQCMTKILHYYHC